MKKPYLLALLVVVFTLAGCNGSTPTTAPVTPPSVDPTGITYPTPIEATPYPEMQQDPAATSAPEIDQMYPWLGDGSILQWPQVIALIQNGQVSRVMQTHDLQVTLTLKDGRTLTAAEPAIDEVLRVIEACGAPCADIAVATE